MDSKFDDFFTSATEHQSISGTSLVVTFLGDYLCHSGGGIWMGSLINFMESLGFNQRFVRSSVFRLKQDGWLDVKKSGRKSYYFMTPERFDEIRAANKKIYSVEKLGWDGKWNIIHISSSTQNDSKQHGKYLARFGFGTLDKGIYIQADQNQLDHVDIEKIAKHFPESHIFTQTSLYSTAMGNEQELVRKAWDLSRLNDDYKAFCDMFNPVWQELKDISVDEVSPEECFKLRLLLVHFYRRIIIRDPLLPAELLPDNWAGGIAQSLAMNIYKKIHLQGRNYVSEHGETVAGPLPLPASDYYARFGGLQPQ
ncbi:phenylacetic acid degradation operon negative regulatory protein PaaX [Photobacterium rosenbergii]|nr:phenylacetic acid degradation operon negative regulatory protein PaaX [Photobacterium rosenbergii]